MKPVPSLVLVSLSLTLGPLVACSSSDTGAGGGDDGGTTVSSATTTTTTHASTSTTTTTDTTNSSTSTGTPGGVAFSFHPQWSGVTAVTVIGNFGQATDWDPATPFATLTDDGTGTFTATADLPDGDYLYLYQVTGDDDAKSGYTRYAMDPRVSGYEPCPAESPTHSENDNPCSKLTVPQGTPDPVQHVGGVVDFHGAPVEGYLVQLDREESDAHHYFTNRVTVGADGAFDLEAAPGKYRLQVLHPTFLSKSDVDRKPKMLKALRRSISSAFDVDDDITIASPEMAYDDYTSMSPIDSATLPTTFAFTQLSGASKVKCTVYGTHNGTGQTVGDPWYDSGYGNETTDDFDGTFTTAHAMEGAVVPGEQYFWGTWQQSAGGAGEVTWSGQSMVFPITWN